MLYNTKKQVPKKGISGTIRSILFRKCFMPKILLDTQLKIDARTIETQKKLYAALIHFYEEKHSFTELTVTQVCHYAHVGRTTFYRHHQDLTDIITVQLLILINDFHQRIDSVTTLNFETGSQAIVTEIRNNPLLFQLMGWSQSTDLMVHILSGEVLNILNIREHDFDHQPILATLLAQNILNFALTISTHPEFNFEQVQQLFNLTIPNLPAPID